MQGWGVLLALRGGWQQGQAEKRPCVSMVGQ